MSQPKPRGRFTSEDMVLLRSTFKDNEALLKLLRKVFLPNQVDESLPIGQIAGVWMDIDFRSMSAEEAKIVAVARQEIIKTTEFYLNQIKFLADSSDEEIDAKAIAANSSR